MSNTNPKLLKLVEMDYTMRHYHGQRKFGPPIGWEGPPPPKGCEVFIGRLPSEVFEDELIPLFSKVGRIYELRTMLTNTGNNRGYAFLIYSSKDEASAAIKELHNYEIRLGRRIAVVKSVDNCRLYLGGIPKTMSASDVMTEMSKMVKGIVNVILYKNCFNRRFNRGFAFIEFSNHWDALSAWKLLKSITMSLLNHKIIVDWAEPEPNIHDDVMKNVKILYIRNLHVHTQTNTIKETIESAINDKVERVKKMYDYAFVHFFKREHAEIVIDKLQKTEIDGSKIEIEWARPVDRKLYKIQKMTKGNAKFSKRNNIDFDKAHNMYENKSNINNIKAVSLDEGIASPEHSDYASSASNERDTNDNRVLDKLYQDSISQCPLLKFDVVSNSFQWPPPKYYFQKYMTLIGNEIYWCTVEFGKPRPVSGRRFYMTSSPCLTLYDAQICAAEFSLRYIRLLELQGCISPITSPSPIYPIIQTKVKS